MKKVELMKGLKGQLLTLWYLPNILFWAVIVFIAFIRLAAKEVQRNGWHNRAVRFTLEKMAGYSFRVDCQEGKKNGR